MILTDLPYGTIKNADLGKHDTSWDVVIEPKKIYDIANRILRKNGKMVLFGNEPFSSKLINESIPNIPFSYRMIWLKDQPAFSMYIGCKKRPMSYYEDILVFSKLGGLENSGVNANHPLKEMFNEALDRSGKTKRFFIDLVGSSASHYFTDGVQFRIPTESKFDLIRDCIDIGYSYDELKAIDLKYKQYETEKHYGNYPSVFNLWEGNKYKSNILKYKKDYDGYHPTQKPVALLEDLIKTYSNEGDTVVDLTMGSGSTGVACKNTGRNFVGIELDDEYFGTAKERIETKSS
ncbi:site-specific DNA-methyltransferase [Aerococcus urinaeequi]|uniref:DNA-methyltransferase n=1 Tax=Aerococcus urinaeequi TaxID=51665 RepID=UPI0021756A9B|nr:site-specific DNA-methyltransferase [Aerococcus urinaeequi]